MRPIDMLVPTYRQMLRALSAWLAKAEAERPDGADALLSARLAPDMFPLATQVRFACVQAREGLYRLRGEDFPTSLDALLDEGRAAGEHPGTIAEARARIKETLVLIDGLAADAAPAADEAPLAHALPMGLVFDLTTETYARDWALPQFFFHVMTAYALLRANGVALGKADYVAHMLGRLRPEAVPAD